MRLPARPRPGCSGLRSAYCRCAPELLLTPTSWPSHHLQPRPYCGRVRESALKGVGDSIIGRRPLSRFVQIDRLAMVKTGAGPTTTPSFSLPHARYTVFVDYDPPTAVTSFALLEDQGRALPDWSSIKADVGVLKAPLVQHELPTGNYRLVIGTTTSTCAWMVQVVLNSMLSWQAPPRRWRPSSPPPEEILVRSGESPAFRVAQTGRYDVSWTVGEAQVGTPDSPLPA